MSAERDYQVDAVRAALAQFESGRRKVLLALPTGLGKTKIICAVVRELGLAPDEVALVVAHTDPLIDQAVKALLEEVPSAIVDREKAEHRAAPMAKIVVGSIQTLKSDRLNEFLHRLGSRIRLLVIDEAHRAAAPSYLLLIERILEAHPSAVVLGVTATPRRTDKVGLGAAFTAAIGGADDWIARKFPWTNTTRASASAGQRPTTLRQTRLLRSLGVPEPRIPTTSAAATALIDSLKTMKAEEQAS